MDPLGHLAPWLFKGTMDNENSECIMSGCMRIHIDKLQLILGQQLVRGFTTFIRHLTTNAM